MGTVRKKRKERQFKDIGKPFIEIEGLVYDEKVNSYVTREDFIQRDNASQTNGLLFQEEQVNPEETEENATAEV